MNRYITLLAVAGLLAYPASIQADMILPPPSALSSSAVMASTLIATPVSTPPTIPAIAAPDSINKTTWITAYASVPDETSDHPFITASGATVADGIIAANWLPFGTHVEIPALFGNKVFTVEDRMNAKFSNRVDIWMPSVAQAVDFGIRKAQVVVLDSNLAMR